jgi:hypothetical protein
MDARKRKFVVAFVLVIGLVIAATPSHVAASSSSTIYSFGTTQPIDGGVPKGSLIYVNVNGNGLLFGRTTTTITATPTTTPTPTPVGRYGVIFHFDPNNLASSYSIDHVFAGHDADDGDNPRHDAMTPLNNQLYGTTLEGGTNNTGLIFSIRRMALATRSSSALQRILATSRTAVSWSSAIFSTTRRRTEARMIRV